MTVQQQHQRTGAPAPQERAVLARLVAWVLVGAWTAVLLAMVFGSARPAGLADLEARIATGDVSAVTVEGGLDEGDRGFATAKLRWRDGPFGYVTTVVEASPGENVPSATRDEASAVVRTDLGERLTADQPDLEIDHAGELTSSTELLGHEVPGWVAATALVAWITTTGLLALLERPRRATRWGWFWLTLLAVPVGPLVFLLAGGPTSRTPAADHERARRLTGGWAFLLALLVGTVLTGA